MPILLAGGVGTRLWPVSRQRHPKQLVRFDGGASLVQRTIERLGSLVEPENIRIVCGSEHAHDIARHMQQAGVDPAGRIIGEPCGRNTAPAILLAVLTVLRDNTDAVLCVFPADHVIRMTENFHEKVRSAVKLAQDGHIVTFGIKPHYPETGYGYIEGGTAGPHGALTIKRFVEKPNLATAKQYLAAGRFFWNSGMFTFKASVIAGEFKKCRPDLFDGVTAMLDKTGTPTLADYQGLDNISFDYAIMEKTDKGMVLPSDFGWSDIGTWKSLYDYLSKDGDGNVTLGDVVTRHTENTLIMGSNRLIAVNSVRDLVVVDTPDAVFVSDLENSRDVQGIVQQLKEEGRNEVVQHRTASWPWGTLTRLSGTDTDTFTVDQLVLYAGSSHSVPGETGGTVRLTVVKGEVSVTGPGTAGTLKTGGATAISGNDSLEIENLQDSEAILVRVTCGEPHG